MRADLRGVRALVGKPPVAPGEGNKVNVDCESLLDDLLTCDDVGFTGWEIDFLGSLDRKRDRELTAKQIEVLHRIARKAGLID